MKIDLHTHSSVSDGTERPAEIVQLAAVGGLDVVALTDHDTTAGWAEAEAAAASLDLQLVRGAEFSTDNNGQSQHLLGYEFDPAHPELVARLEEGARSRRERVPRTLALLAKLKVPVSMDAVAEAAGDGVVGRPHIADAMVAAGHVPDRAAAFAEYLGEGQAAYVERAKLAIEDAIELIVAAGGVAVVAHPRGRGAAFSEQRFAELRAMGLAGIEVDHEEHDLATRADLRAVADRLDMVVTGSSDYHGDGKKGHPLGCHLTSPAAFERLLGNR